MSDWDRRWMDMAHLVGSWSKDRSRKVGAVIVDHDNNLIQIGWNGFPRGIDDNVDSRHMRPDKYHWTEHAERNAINNAAAMGNSTTGCKIYLPLFPCVGCARSIIQAKIIEVISYEPNWNDLTYAEEFAMSKSMFGEVPWMTYRFIDGHPPIRKDG